MEFPAGRILNEQIDGLGRPQHARHPGRDWGRLGVGPQRGRGQSTPPPRRHRRWQRRTALAAQIGHLEDPAIEGRAHLKLVVGILHPRISRGRPPSEEGVRLGIAVQGEIQFVFIAAAVGKAGVQQPLVRPQAVDGPEVGSADLVHIRTPSQPGLLRAHHLHQPSGAPRGPRHCRPH